MNIQTIAMGAVVVLAILYLVSRLKKKGGCGGGCGCSDSAKKKDG